MKETIYVYKEYCDENPYGEEIIELYRDRNKAVERLKARVSEAYGAPFDEIPEGIMLDEGDTYQEDYISIDNGDGAVSYWIVEEYTVIE